nr:MAG TPA: hypothetical protein [Caudoviricetes sp.]
MVVNGKIPILCGFLKKFPGKYYPKMLPLNSPNQTTYNQVMT